MPCYTTNKTSTTYIRHTEVEETKMCFRAEPSKKYYYHEKVIPVRQHHGGHHHHGHHHSNRSSVPSVAYYGSSKSSYGGSSYRPSVCEPVVYQRTSQTRYLR
ncbi:Uu.00g040710.m01.CDS01 [Anthostomella pinea]|uniref:Uu.00g040710.m01.CDS01 n=1 Tax=Anthostomella pinea TaxID=933095 RepID=A0AAI8V5A4_9PEZI|nr:Uu.00g040710.m01.CDS01 [Anthostomella pinea]